MASLHRFNFASNFVYHGALNFSISCSAHTYVMVCPVNSELFNRSHYEYANEYEYDFFNLELVTSSELSVLPVADQTIRRLYTV